MNAVSQHKHECLLELTIMPVLTAIPLPQYVFGTMSPKPTERNVIAISHIALSRLACSSSWNLLKINFVALLSTSNLPNIWRYISIVYNLPISTARKHIPLQKWKVFCKTERNWRNRKNVSSWRVWLWLWNWNCFSHLWSI